MPDIDLLTPKKTAAALGIGISTLWRWRANRFLPAPIVITPRVTRWRATDIEQFIKERAAQSEQAEG